MMVILATTKQAWQFLSWQFVDMHVTTVASHDLYAMVANAGPEFKSIMFHHVILHEAIPDLVGMYWQTMEGTVRK